MNSQLRVMTPLDAVDSAMVALGYIFISLSVKDVAIVPKENYSRGFVEAQT